MSRVNTQKRNIHEQHVMSLLVFLLTIYYQFIIEFLRAQVEGKNNVSQNEKDRYFE